VSEGFIALAFTFIGLFIFEPIVLAISRLFGLYAVVQERTCHVYVLFGKVIGMLHEPGWYLLPAAIGPAALIVNFFGKCYVVDLRLDQEYLRSQPVNSEEGAPMGIGIWYEMKVSDPVNFLFKNTDPRRAAVIRPNMIGQALREISEDPAVAEALFEILETQKIIDNKSHLTLFYGGAHQRVLGQLLASQDHPVIELDPRKAHRQPAPPPLVPGH
jgi:hypothetical protein